MAVTDLLSRDCTLVLRDATGTVTDDGEETLEETLVTTVCELQQRTRQEDAGQGELSDSTWLLVLPSATVISTGDQVLVDDVIYELVGAPWHVRNPRTGVESHVECTVRRTAAAEDAS